MLWLILIVPLIWPWVAKFIWRHKITYAEIVVQLVIVVIATLGAYAAANYHELRDVELWSGKVVRKAAVKVPCEHSYPCNCRQVCTGFGKSRTCSMQCDTCYEHLYDIDWRVYSDLGTYVNIRRIDQQGLKEPPRFTKAIIGEPWAEERSYTNYIKADPNSLFNNKDLVEKYKSKIPNYPNVYDYYRVNRVIVVGGYVLPNKYELNKWLNTLAKSVGKKYHVNVLMVVCPFDKEYGLALRDAWLGGKKNDLIVVVGSKKFPSIDWVYVFSWAKDPVINIDIRDALKDMSLGNPTEIAAMLKTEITKYWSKRPIEDYKYIAETKPNSTTAIIIAFIVAVLASVATTWYFVTNNIEE